MVLVASSHVAISTTRLLWQGMYGEERCSRYRGTDVEMGWIEGERVAVNVSDGRSEGDRDSKRTTTSGFTHA